MARVLLSGDSFNVSVSRRLWSLKNHWMKMPVSFVRQVRTTGSLCSMTGVVLSSADSDGGLCDWLCGETEEVTD